LKPFIAVVCGKTEFVFVGKTGISSRRFSGRKTFCMMILKKTRLINGKKEKLT